MRIAFKNAIFVLSITKMTSFFFFKFNTGPHVYNKIPPDVFLKKDNYPFIV